MAAAKYLFNLDYFPTTKWYPAYGNDQQSLQDEFARAKRQATLLLGHAGGGGSAIDIDDMLHGTSTEGYPSRPWEDDAFYCGEIAGSYWSQDRAPDDVADNHCSRQYAFTHNGRQRNATGGAGGSTVSATNNKNGG